MENNQIEIDLVKKVISNYISGTYEANVELLQSAFHKNAIMSGFLGKQMLIGNPQPFLDDISSNPSMKSENSPYEAKIEYINVTKNVANVVLLETGFKGSASLMNNFHLIKDAEWKIISKTFTTL